MEKINDIKAIVGLGNPGRAYYYHRHSIGFRVIDALGQLYGARWQSRNDMEYAEIHRNGKKILLIKPQTFMNASGKVISFLSKEGIKPEQMLVIHDELELPFGKVAFKVGGSARGHKGLKSIIAACGESFARIRAGIGRPENKEQVPEYVLQNFSESVTDVDSLIESARKLIENYL